MAEGAEDDKRSRGRRALVALLLLVAGLSVLVFAFVVLAVGAPDYAADGSREAYSTAIELLLYLTWIGGTGLTLFAIYRVVTVLLPFSAVKVTMLLLAALVGLPTVSVEIFLIASLTEAQPPGSEPTGGGDWDWD